MDIGHANSVLTERRTGKENADESSASSVVYQKLLAETFDMNRRILTFKSKPPAPVEPIPRALLTPPSHKAKSRPRRHIPQTAERTLDAPNLSDDFYLNLLDWGSNNIVAIALESTVYLWNASNSSTSELVTVSDDDGPVTSISWAADGRHIAIGLNNSCVELWDTLSVKLLRKLKGHHERVGSLAWNKEILTTGSRDGNIINNDVRVRSHIVQTYMGHQQEVCGLKWSASGQQLASGGNDNLVFIWDRSLASPNVQWLHRIQDHTTAVKALAWCPFQANLLASGGGGGDDTIKFWNVHTGSCLNSVNTGLQVCGLLWNSHERELLSSHGFTDNKLILWKYLSMVRLAELRGHTSRVLYLTQSPDGFICCICWGRVSEVLECVRYPRSCQGRSKTKSDAIFSKVLLHSLNVAQTNLPNVAY